MRGRRLWNHQCQILESTESSGNPFEDPTVTWKSLGSTECAFQPIREEVVIEMGLGVNQPQYWVRLLTKHRITPGTHRVKIDGVEYDVEWVSHVDGDTELRVVKT